MRSISLDLGYALEFGWDFNKISWEEFDKVAINYHPIYIHFHLAT